MDARAAGLLKRLSRELVYRPLDAAIGQQVSIVDQQGLEAALAPYVPGLSGFEYVGPEPRYFVGALMKYGIIDATFACPTELLDGPGTRRGLKLVRELGFAEPGDEPGTEPFDDDPAACLEELADGLSSDRAYLRVFLTSERPSPTEALRAMRLKDLPADFLPRTFKIDDACVTNSDYVWMLKHFYM